jgi:hypothetical protein
MAASEVEQADAFPLEKYGAHCTILRTKNGAFYFL